MIKTNNLSIVKINDLEYRLSGNMVYIILGLKTQEVYYDVELNYGIYILT